MQELWDIYDRYIKPFEQTDDDYRKRLNAIYKEETKRKDKWKNFLKDFGKVSWSFLKSFAVAFVTTALFVVAIAQAPFLVIGLVVVLAVGTVVMVNVPEESVPDWLKGAKETADDVKESALKVLEHGPIVIVEMIGQGFMDQVQTPEGIASVAGTVSGTLAGCFAGSKINAKINANKAAVKEVKGASVDKPKTKAEILAENKEKGRKFEIEKVEDLKKVANSVEEQITIVTKDGTKVRIDAMGYDKASGELVLQEYKSSITAPLTKNQNLGFPQITESGGLIVGKGKGVFKGGVEIPPGTEIKIIRSK